MTKAKSVKTAISLTRETFERAEKLRRAEGLSRSEFYARAIDKALRDMELKRAIDAYVESYRKYPETPEEIAEAARGTADWAKEYPW